MANSALPADLRGRRSHLPGPVPIEIEAAAAPAREAAATAIAEQASTAAFVGHLPVVFLAGRSGAEDESVLLVAEGVEHHLKAVGVIHRGVAPAVAHDDAGRVPVVAHDAKVNRVVRDHDAHLCSLRRRLPLIGGALAEPADRLHRGPHRVAEDVAVECRRVFDRHGLCDFAGCLGHQLDACHRCYRCDRTPAALGRRRETRPRGARRQGTVPGIRSIATSSTSLYRSRRRYGVGADSTSGGRGAATVPAARSTAESPRSYGRMR